MLLDQAATCLGLSTHITLVISGKDLIGRAETGSGKTLSFAIPAIDYTIQQPPAGRSFRARPVTLIMCPTRELAGQINDDVQAIGKVR